MRKFLREKIDILLFLCVLSAIISLFLGIFDFVYYTILLLIIFLGAIVYYKKLIFYDNIISGLLALLVLHFFGSNIQISGDSLYHYSIITGVFAYDNIVHATGAFVATIFAYSFFHPYVIFDRTKLQRFYFFSLLVLVGLGIGAGIEMLELIAVVFFNASQLVGGYLNNALDLVFDTIGASIAAIYFVYFRK